MGERCGHSTQRFGQSEQGEWKASLDSGPKGQAASAVGIAHSVSAIDPAPVINVPIRMVTDRLHFRYIFVFTPKE